MGHFWKIQRSGGSYEKSLPWGGGYGYFLEPHNFFYRLKSENNLVQQNEQCHTQENSAQWLLNGHTLGFHPWKKIGPHCTV